VEGVAEARLIERDSELSELRSALDDARRGAGRLVVIEGVAGIGKTALVRAAQDAARDAGMRVLRARGTELERDFPFALVRQLFEPELVRAGPARRRALLAGAARLAGPVVGVELETDDDTGANGSDASLDPSFATLNSLFWLTSNVAEDTPTLLAVDDAHWADEASLRYLTFLLPRLEDLPVLLVVAGRPGEPGSERELLAQLAADPAARVLRPGALTADAVAEMVREAFASGADEAFCAACREATGGNPFMLSELLVELHPEGGAGAAPPAAEVREIAPAAIRRSVLIRLGRLTDKAQRLAVAIAVLGDDADVAVAGALAQIDDDAAREAIDALAASGVLAPEHPLRFRHPLLRTAVYADVPPAELSAAHGRAAQLLAERGAKPERLALHLLATDPVGDQATVGTLAAAAQRALDRAAPEAAFSYLERALAEPAQPPARPDLIRLLITAAIRAGVGRPEVEAIVGDPIGELSADDDTLATSAWQVALALLASGQADEVGPLLDRAVGIATERGDVALALKLESLVAATSQLSPAAAQARFARHAGAIAPGTPAERLWLAMQSWWGTFLGRSAAESAELARRALADGRIFAEQPDLPPPGQAILVLARAEDLDRAADRVDAITADASRRGSATGLGQASYLRAYVTYLSGEVAGAEADARSAVETARRGGYLQAVPVFPALLVDLLIERDELDAADEELAGGGWTGALPDNYWWPPIRLARARLRLAQRRVEEAIADLSELERLNERLGIISPFYSVGSRLAFALAAEGRVEEARAAAGDDLVRARAWGAPSAVSTALRALARATDDREDQLEWLAEAVAVLETSPRRLEYARALADHGAALRRANRRTEARERLRAVLELARRGGALAIAKRAHEELEASGEKLRPLLAGGVESLTPSERRVAQLAAEGLTNREVAQSLFLTVKTVETHLSHTYRKLGIGSRTELPEALAE
jgi:DNA-binding NarL/FixJ family response regulator